MPDFRGFNAAVAAAVKPDYADVVARARRRKRRWGGFGAAAVALVLAGGGGTYALTADRTPAPVKPAPVATPGPWRTVVPQDGGRGPQPQPVYTAMENGDGYDITEPDEPLTGLFTYLLAGDLDHLYLEYQDCRGGPCRRMLAASADRGRTWRKHAMPAKSTTATKAGSYEQPTVTIVERNLVVAYEGWRPKGSFRPGELPDPLYWTSTDGGATWRRSNIRAVDAVPAGWRVRQEENGLIAVDPATGDLARLTWPPGKYLFGMVLDEVPPAAGIWTVEGGALRVSEDGGRTWDRRMLPKGIESQRGSVITGDGRMVYAIDDRKDKKAAIHISADGGRTWRSPVVVDTKGPVLTLLPIDERTVIVEGQKDAFRSTDQGSTFTRVGASLGARGHAIPGGFTIPTNNNEVSAWLSADGAEWTYVRHPQVP